MDRLQGAFGLTSNFICALNRWLRSRMWNLLNLIESARTRAAAVAAETEEISRTLDKQRHLFTLMGVFGAISIYLNRFSGERAHVLIRLGILAGFLAVILIALLLILRVYDEIWEEPGILSLEGVFWFALFVLLTPILVAIAYSIQRFATAFLVFFAVLPYAVIVFFSLVILARKPDYTDVSPTVLVLAWFCPFMLGILFLGIHNQINAATEVSYLHGDTVFRPSENQRILELVQGVLFWSSMASFLLWIIGTFAALAYLVHIVVAVVSKRIRTALEADS